MSRPPTVVGAPVTSRVPAARVTGCDSVCFGVNAGGRPLVGLPHSRCGLTVPGRGRGRAGSDCTCWLGRRGRMAAVSTFGGGSRRGPDRAGRVVLATHGWPPAPARDGGDGERGVKARSPDGSAQEDQDGVGGIAVGGEFAEEPDRDFGAVVVLRERLVVMRPSGQRAWPSGWMPGLWRRAVSRSGRHGTRWVPMCWRAWARRSMRAGWWRAGGPVGRC
jgi:hypothetical protein